MQEIKAHVDEKKRNPQHGAERIFCYTNKLIRRFDEGEMVIPDRALGSLGTLIRDRIVPQFHRRISAGCAFQTIARGAERASWGKGSDVHYLPLRCSSPTVKLRPTASLLVPVLLSNPWREKPYRFITMHATDMLRSITHQYVLRSLCCGAFSRDCLVRGNGPLFLQEAQCRYERSANVSFEAPL
jgi:hypothetical protein